MKSTPSHLALIVVPCYNESKRLNTSAFESYIRGQSDHAFLFVDDGSTDETWTMLQRLCATEPERLMCMRLEKNSGKAEAVRQGVLAALRHDPQFIGYWDADLATPLTAIGRFCDLMLAREQVNVVMGSRVQLLGRSIDRRPARHYIGRAFATLASLVLRLPVYDTQCGAKLFRCRPSLRDIFTSPFLTSWVFDIELLARYSYLVGTTKAKETIYEYPLEQWCDVPGSKFRLHHGFRAAWDLTVIRRHYRPTNAGHRAKEDAVPQDNSFQNNHVSS